MSLTTNIQTLVPIKNYLSNYIIPSTNVNTPNPGNGNFELQSTAGWSLCHSALTSLVPSSVATATNAFSSTSGGTAAAGTLSFSTQTASPLSGTCSGSLSSSAMRK